MRIREGGLYRNREGEKVGPIRLNPSNSDMPWCVSMDGKRHTFTAYGSYLKDGTDSPRDLVAEWIEEKPAKAIDEVTLDDYRRGVAKLYEIGRAY